MSEVIKLKTGKKTIAIRTTDQKLSAHAGPLTCWGFLHLRKFRAALGAARPQVRPSPPALKVPAIALGFIAGILAGADQLTRLAPRRGDPLLPAAMEIKRLPSQSTLSRFLAGFDGAGKNLRAFRALWHDGRQRLPSRRGGSTLDLEAPSFRQDAGAQPVPISPVGLPPRRRHPAPAISSPSPPPRFHRDTHTAEHNWLELGNERK